MVLDSDLRHGTGIQGWFSDSFLELNVMDGDFRATSDISGSYEVTDLRNRKGLCWGHEHDRVVAHRGLSAAGGHTSVAAG